MTISLLQQMADYDTMPGMNTLMRLPKLFAVNFAAVILLFVAFKITLFGIIGWHDGLNLDWYTVYYPALQTADPFTVLGYFNPPWLAWILSPLGLLTAVDSHVLWIVLILLITTRCVYALGGNWLSVVLTVISPGFLITIINGQVDVLVLLGLLAGSWLLIAIKPQVAGLAIVYDALNGRIDWRSVLIGTAVVLTFLPMMLGLLGNGPSSRVSITPWPWGIPFGVLLFGMSLLRRDKWLGAMSTFFFAPYLSASSVLVYSAIGTSRYGRMTAILFAGVIWYFGSFWM